MDNYSYRLANIQYSRGYHHIIILLISFKCVLVSVTMWKQHWTTKRLRYCSSVPSFCHIMSQHHTLPAIQKNHFLHVFCMFLSLKFSSSSILLQQLQHKWNTREAGIRMPQAGNHWVNKLSDLVQSVHKHVGQIG